ncbi:MAG: hypothetical protein WBD79_14465 [Anaerolineae bacterium]
MMIAGKIIALPAEQALTAQRRHAELRLLRHVRGGPPAQAAEQRMHQVMGAENPLRRVRCLPAITPGGQNQRPEAKRWQVMGELHDPLRPGR